MFTLDEIWTNSESFKNCDIYTIIISCFLLLWSIYINIIGKLTSRSCYIPAYYCEEALILASTLYQDQSKWPSSRYFPTLRKNSYISPFYKNVILTLTESNSKPFLFWNVHFKADHISKYTMLYVLLGSILLIVNWTSLMVDYCKLVDWM